MEEQCSTHGREEKFMKVWVGNPEVTRQHGIHRHGCEDNIKIDLKEKE
jgi:hypothetical protein